MNEDSGDYFGDYRDLRFRIPSSPLPFRRFGPVLNDPDDLPVSIFRDLIPPLTSLTHEGPPSTPLSPYQTTRSPHTTTHDSAKPRRAPHPIFVLVLSFPFLRCSD